MKYSHAWHAEDSENFKVQVMPGFDPLPEERHIPKSEKNIFGAAKLSGDGIESDTDIWENQTRTIASEFFPSLAQPFASKCTTGEWWITDYETFEQSGVFIDSDLESISASESDCFDFIRALSPSPKLACRSEEQMKTDHGQGTLCREYINGCRPKNHCRNDVHVLRHWFLANLHNPFPKAEEKMALARYTNMTPCQVSTWFVNERKRSVYYKAVKALTKTTSMSGRR